MNKVENSNELLYFMVFSFYVVIMNNIIIKEKEKKRF